MTDTPSSAPKDPAGGDASVRGGDPHPGSPPNLPPPNLPPPQGAPTPGPQYGPPGSAPADQPVYGYQQLAAPTTLDVGNAISYGLEKFRSNMAPWLAVTAVGVVIYLTFLLVVQTFEPNSLLSLVLLFLAVMVGLWLLQAAMVRGALHETDGVKPVFGSFFQVLNAGNVLLTALLAFLGTWLGLALCVLPGLAVGVLCMFSLHFVVDQDLGPIDAIRASAMLVARNPVQVLLLALSVVVITLLGLLACGIGVLFAGPVCVLAVTYAYRGLTGGRLVLA
ncbi:DUF2189 domain-containing protein [Nocardia farcinica]|uniref:hypothetical protein n=1 Tax=Nocardia farcinica TaxID=37329 RepID=UPI0018949A82|nr:hypothetical protein [Nocardia farcinica]MBF6291463.1 hypothetical protein [Nocardia farcinica]MBF6378246.1 hypothetical protein [Nocardia farcinica]